MKRTIVYSSDPVTLLGGGAALTKDVAEALALAPTCVAADGGAELARVAGVPLEALIGDFDSVAADTLALTPPERRHHITEQDSTDFDKALRHIEAPVVVCVGFLGKRLDHQLGALNVLVGRPDRACVLLGESEIAFLCPPQLQVDTARDDIVSLFPLGDCAGTSTGLRWSIDGLKFHPLHQTSTLNAAEGPIALTMDRPAMIVMLPRAYLGEITQALARAPQDARWPARAERYRDQTQS
ncbi:thiamine diphosphokinase [uncultured Tateyamaria sp.]|uniref:thiamine diphosphokinase n=1 Tax=uncultured Tateyamaria sp. TaxID=455651 RepID=UPI002614BFF8|nr:thiamine diphosphokinase [uncultured Tateyamaria sp.]